MSYDYYITPDEYEAAEKNGISRQLLTVRVRTLGWDKRRALTTPVEQHAPRSEWIDVAKANGISRDTFWGRVNRQGWEPERAATAPLIPADESQKAAVKKRQRFSDEIIALRKANGIPRTTFSNRISAGWDEYRAATEPQWTPQQIAQAGAKAFKKKHGARETAHIRMAQKRRDAK